MYFRTRIFSISILTVSAVLAVVISLSWSRIMKVELEHLDSRLCMEVKRITRMPSNLLSITPVPDSAHKDQSGSRLIDDLVNKLRINSASDLLILVESSEHGVLTESQGEDVQQIISTLNWQSADPLEVIAGKQTSSRCQLVFFTHQKNRWRGSFFQGQQAQSFLAVDVSATTSDLESTLQSAMIVVIPFSLLLSILGAWFITTNTTRPIKRLHQSMQLVTQKNFNHRLPAHKEDQEFTVLINAYNTMLDRLEDSFQQASRFTADAAHELKTPLTILRGKIEQAVISENSSQLDLNAILDEVGHLSAITRKLLLLSQADSCSMALHLEAINMAELLDELTGDMELLSDGLVLHCEIEQPLYFKGDIVLLRQLLNNLLVNVIRYSLQEKGVTIEAKRSDDVIEVLISNFCVAMKSEVREQLFDRFYRGEPEQMQGISGSGLGLSLAREIARAHGGDLTLQASKEDVVVMRLSLPTVK
ncbi:hypothetical protein GCM10007916_11940 [Psychromonas marina]|uniref:histidine kinase n=1 Tax=Psychromonas marina TaxID=88364 RepID=A0ABQ6DYA1_9GAMM|nr:ATP-binding protein [Psychromonas marina]GLS90127.1 hypothetical protein GCM10007916_11940 [Psychromonas marina]